MYMYREVFCKEPLMELYKCFTILVYQVSRERERDRKRERERERDREREREGERERMREREKERERERERNNIPTCEQRVKHK